MFRNKNGCFDCDRCPKNNDPQKGRFCVAWYEKPGFREGKAEILRSCGFPVLFDLLTDNCKTTDVMVANISQFPGRLEKALVNSIHEQHKLSKGNGA